MVPRQGWLGPPPAGRGLTELWEVQACLMRLHSAFRPMAGLWLARRSSVRRELARQPSVRRQALHFAQTPDARTGLLRGGRRQAPQQLGGLGDDENDDLNQIEKRGRFSSFRPVPYSRSSPPRSRSVSQSNGENVTL